MSAFFAVFLTVLFAELGDKTQIVTLLFSTNSKLTPLYVFLASAAALTLSSAIAVLIGAIAKTYLQQVPLKLISGVIFILMGAWTIYEYFKS